VPLANSSDDIAGEQSRFTGGAAFADGGDDKLPVIGFADRLADNPVRSLLEALGTHQAGSDVEGLIDRDGKTNALSADADGDIEADHLAIDIQQRPSGVAWVDAGVALNEVVVFLLVANLHVAVQGADDPAGHRVLVAIGVADGDHLLALHQVARGPEMDRRQRLLRVKLDDSEIGLRVVRNQARDGRSFVGQRDLNVADAFDHMIVCEDVAAGIDDDSRTHAVHLPHGVGCAKRGVLRPHILTAVNTDDRGLRLVDRFDDRRVAKL